MKIVLTGATGLIGSEVLDQCIAHNYIERIFVITRKPLDQKYYGKAAKGKVTEIIHDNFEEYPEALLRRLRDEGVEGCIWALGRRYENFKSKEEAEKVTITYPMKAAEAFAKELATALSPQRMPKAKFPFRFIFLSVWGAEQDQNRGLWAWSDWRKTKGTVTLVKAALMVTGLTADHYRCRRESTLRHSR
ncbi:hypothetical protein BAUCODRAFT_68197 [Baudoinia panamericana UAMH 10762]|uniref:Thioester reductase (TE) domain-containing protein n=1 Tax=Baudoinia panamericana (strain UAMH 10762) TaxID=717646 RepID=M2LS83_BAUPA|nr:uncharacterized protein BAUCODRAFT_68197 [Baudoinia panamericana UAMH 10762]EMC97332.1 hypothetical protein BAUCODRAFT_68197 [Baudoinia panamericana UAMH 10762]